MRKEFIKCESCKMEIPSGICELAAYRTKINGREYLFCCENHAKRYLKKGKAAKR